MDDSLIKKKRQIDKLFWGKNKPKGKYKQMADKKIIKISGWNALLEKLQHILLLTGEECQ